MGRGHLVNCLNLFEEMFFLDTLIHVYVHIIGKEHKLYRYIEGCIPVLVDTSE